MKKIWVLVFILCLSVVFYGQSKKSNLTGVVKDSLKQPLVFATITLSRVSQPKVSIRNTYSNDKGNFRFNNIDTGNYFVDVNHLGYVTKQEKIKITGELQAEMGEILLMPKSYSLKEVKVETRKPLIEQENDKVIFNVENDPMAKTETAIDILRKTPFVAVDGDDNVQVNGQTNFMVLLNGKETAMFTRNVKEALRGFPGALITKIEVITSPSAKYDAEGVGGIINIVTRKKTKGYNGSVSVNYNTIKRYNHSVNFSAKLGKWGFNISHFLNSGGHINGKAIFVTTPHIQSVYKRRTEDGNTTRSNFGTNQNIELAYEADSLNTISIYGGLGKFKGDYTSDDIHTTEFSSMPPSLVKAYFQTNWDYPQHSIGIDFIRKFRNKKEKEFSIRLNNEYGSDESTLLSWMDIVSGQRNVLNTNNNPSNQYTIQSDYILPSKNGRLETGGKIVLRRTNSDFRSLIKYNPADNYQEVPGNNDYFKYEQDVYSTYGTYSFKVKKINYRFGLRVEHTRVNGDFISSNTKIQQPYTTILPNVLITSKLTKTYTLVISYNKRLQRPYIWNLNPFINNTDSLNISYGNPNLDAQMFHVISLQNRFQKKSTFFGVTLTGRYSGNSIVSYDTFDNIKGITSNTSDNIGKDIQFTLNSTINTKFTPEWNFSLNMNFTYNHIKNKKTPAQVNEGIGGNGNLNTSYIFTKKFSMSGNTGFWRGPVTFQSKRKANVWYSIGVIYKLFKEKMTASISVENFFQKNIESRRTITDAYFSKIETFLWPGRTVRVGLNYNFGKLREGVSKKKGVNNDDLMGKDLN